MSPQPPDPDRQPPMQPPSAGGGSGGGSGSPGGSGGSGSSGGGSGSSGGSGGSGSAGGSGGSGGGTSGAGGSSGSGGGGADGSSGSGGAPDVGKGAAAPGGGRRGARGGRGAAGKGDAPSDADDASPQSDAADEDITPPTPFTQQLGRITIFIIAALFGVFAVANSQPVDFSWVFGETLVREAPDGDGEVGGVPLIVLLLAAFVIGAVVAILTDIYVSRARRARKSAQQRRDREGGGR